MGGGYLLIPLLLRLICMLQVLLEATSVNIFIISIITIEARTPIRTTNLAQILFQFFFLQFGNFLFLCFFTNNNIRLYMFLMQIIIFTIFFFPGNLYSLSLIALRKLRSPLPLKGFVCMLNIGKYRYTAISFFLKLIYFNLNTNNEIQYF